MNTSGAASVDSPAQAGSGRLLLGICLVLGGSLVQGATLNYILTPMREELGFSQAAESVALAIPFVASLLVVFVAGQFGERLGHRRVIAWMSAAVALGSVLVAVAPGINTVVVGLLVESMGATAIQIIVLSLLSDRFTAPTARAAAFGTYGMVGPTVWLVFPVLAGLLVDFSWRWVPLVWVLAGLVILLAAGLLLPPAQRILPVGEFLTAVLAGVALAAAVQTLTRIDDDGLVSVGTLGAAAAALAAGVGTVLLLRRRPEASFSLQPLSQGATRALLTIVVIIPLINTLFLMTMAFQYLYGLTVLQTALALVPAQAAAVLGSRLFAAPLMARWGPVRAGQILFIALAASLLVSLAVTPTSPLWVPILYVAVFNMLAVAASITITNGLMQSDPATGSGLLSAYRGSGIAVGGALAVVVMNSAVFGLAQWTMQDAFEANGLTQEQAQQQMSQVQAQTSSPNVLSQYAVPLPDGTDVSSVLAETIARGLHINGLLGAALCLLALFLLSRTRLPQPV